MIFKEIKHVFKSKFGELDKMPGLSWARSEDKHHLCSKNRNRIKITLYQGVLVPELNVQTDTGLYRWLMDK